MGAAAAFAFSSSALAASSSPDSKSFFFSSSNFFFSASAFFAAAAFLLLGSLYSAWAFRHSYGRHEANGQISATSDESQTDPPRGSQHVATQPSQKACKPPPAHPTFSWMVFCHFGQESLKAAPGCKSSPLVHPAVWVWFLVIAVFGDPQDLRRVPTTRISKTELFSLTPTSPLSSFNLGFFFPAPPPFEWASSGGSMTSGDRCKHLLLARHRWCFQNLPPCLAKRRRHRTLPVHLHAIREPANENDAMFNKTQWT